MLDTLIYFKASFIGYNLIINLQYIVQLISIWNVTFINIKQLELFEEKTYILRVFIWIRQLNKNTSRFGTNKYGCLKILHLLQ